MELAIGDIEQDRLPITPLKIGSDEKDDPNRGAEPFYITPMASHALGMNGLFAGIEMPMHRLSIKVIHHSLPGCWAFISTQGINSCELSDVVLRKAYMPCDLNANAIYQYISTD
jgi:hypothetical protein